MATYDLQHLLATVEQVRAELHPDLPSELLEAVVRAEDANVDNPDRALKAVEAAITKYVAGVEDES